MKRVANLTRIFSFFDWQQCLACAKDFRRERGWRRNARPWADAPHWIHVCGTCAPTEREADARLKVEEKARGMTAGELAARYQRRRPK